MPSLIPARKGWFRVAYEPTVDRACLPDVDLIEHEVIAWTEHPSGRLRPHPLTGTELDDSSDLPVVLLCPDRTYIIDGKPEQGDDDVREEFLRHEEERQQAESQARGTCPPTTLSTEEAQRLAAAVATTKRAPVRRSSARICSVCGFQARRCGSERCPQERTTTGEETR